MTAKELINIDPELMGGTPVFRGTRVPVRSLIEHLQSNVSIEEFLDDFPSVSKEQAVELLDVALNSALEKATV